LPCRFLFLGLDLIELRGRIAFWKIILVAVSVLAFRRRTLIYRSCGTITFLGRWVLRGIFSGRWLLGLVGGGSVFRFLLSTICLWRRFCFFLDFWCRLI
jgi:hypothetical protein